MFRIHTPLFNEAGPADAGGGFPADDFAAALEQGMAQQQAEASGQKPQEQVSQPSQELATKVKTEETPKEVLTGKDKLAGKLGKLAEEEVEQVADKLEDDTPPGDQSPKAVSRWKQLRQIEDEHKQLQPKLKEYEAKITELQKAQVPPEIEAELTELRQLRDITDITRSPEYVKTVAEPLEHIGGEIGEVAEAFKIDQDKLLDAMREPKEWLRNIAIEKVVKAAEKAALIAAEESGEEAEGIPGGVMSTLANAASRLHKVWQKDAELKHNASQLRQSKEAEQTQKSQLSTAEQEKAWEAASNESKAIIETNLGPLFKTMPEAKKAELFEAIKNARISDDPVTRAFQAHAPEVLAAMTDVINDLRRENAGLKKTQNGLVAAKPGTRQNHGEPVKKAAPGSDFDDFEDELSNAMRTQYA